MRRHGTRDQSVVMPPTQEKTVARDNRGCGEGQDQSQCESISNLKIEKERCTRILTSSQLKNIHVKSNSVYLQSDTMMYVHEYYN